MEILFYSTLELNWLLFFLLKLLFHSLGNSFPETKWLLGWLKGFGRGLLGFGTPFGRFPSPLGGWELVKQPTHLPNQLGY